MISVIELLYKLDMRLNKKSNLLSQSIPKADKLLVLNEVQKKLIKQKLNGNNIYNIGFDGFTKRYEDLQNLVVDFEKVPVNRAQSAYPSYTADISSLKESYMFPLEMYVGASKGGCLDRVVTINKIVKHGDLAVFYNNNNYSPSFEYQETIATISSNVISIYTDNTFTINDLYISYLRYPKQIALAGIPDMQGNVQTNQDCELHDYLQDELLDLAVQELAMQTDNQPQVNFATQVRNKINE